MIKVMLQSTASALKQLGYDASYHVSKSKVPYVSMVYNGSLHHVCYFKDSKKFRVFLPWEDNRVLVNVYGDFIKFVKKRLPLGGGK